MGSNIQQNVLEAIELVAANKVASFGFDTTEIATVISKLDNGNYWVSNGKIKYEAKPTDDTPYAENSQIYVTVTNGDYNLDKIIAGRYENKTGEEKVYLHKDPYERLLVYKTWDATSSEDYPTFNNSNPLGHPTLLGVEVFCKVVETEEKNPYSLKISFKKEEKDLAFFIINSEDFMGNPYNMDPAIGHKFLFVIPSGLNLLDDSIHCDFEVSENILSWSAMLNFGYDLESSAVKQALGQVYIDTNNGIKTYSKNKEEDGYIGSATSFGLSNETVINDFNTLFFDLGLTKQNNNVHKYPGNDILCILEPELEKQKYKIEFKSFIKAGSNTAEIKIGDTTLDNIIASGLWNKHTIEIEATSDTPLNLQINNNENPNIPETIVYLKDFVVYALNTAQSLGTINLSWIKDKTVYDKDNLLSSATVKWYRYIPNTEDQGLGVGWQMIKEGSDKEYWSLDLNTSDSDTGVRPYLNPDIAEERFKAVIVLDTEIYMSNTLVLKNRDYVDEGKAVSSETMTLKLSDDGIYLYDNVGQLFENDKNTKTITATSNQQREEDYAEVYWLIPKNSTMIAEPQLMSKKTGDVEQWYWDYAPNILFDTNTGHDLERFASDVSNLNNHSELLQEINNYYIVGGRNDTPWLDFSFNIKTQYQPNYLNNTILCKAYLKSGAAVTTEWGSIDLKFVSANNSGIEASLGIELEGTKDYFVQGDTESITLHAFVYDENGYRFNSQPSTITWYSFNGNKFIETETEASTVEEGDETTTEGNEDETTKENTPIGSGATLTITNNGKSAQVIKAVCKWNSETTGKPVQLTAYYIIPYYTTDKVYQLEGPTRFVYDSLGRNPSPSDSEKYKILDSEGDISSFTVESNSNDIVVKEPAAADEDSDFSFYIQAPLLAPAEEKFYYLNFYNGGLVFQYPLLLLRNTYAFKEINEWKGTTESTETHILSPMIGAGSKNDDNQFTGVMMGTFDNSPTGLYGFKDGVATFGFEEGGSAFLGADETTGRIEFETGNNSSLKIRTSQFDLCAEDKDGKKIAILRNSVEGKPENVPEDFVYSENKYNLFKVGTEDKYIRFSPHDGLYLKGTVISWDNIKDPPIAENGKISVENIEGLAGIIPNLDNITETWYQSTDPSIEWYKKDEDGNVIVDTRGEHKSDLWHCTAEDFIKIYNPFLPDGEQWEGQTVIDTIIFNQLKHNTTVYFGTNVEGASFVQGDLWISFAESESEEDKIYSYNDTEWVDKTNNYKQLLNFFTNTQSNWEGKTSIKIWNYVNEPAGPNDGDIWCCEKGSKWIWYETINEDETKSYEWKRINIADEIFDKLDGKSQVFVITPTPPYYVGDLWIQLNSSEGTDDNIYICRKSRGKGETYHAEDWTLMDTNSEFEASINQTIEEMKQQINNATIQTWYQAEVPSEKWSGKDTDGKDIPDTREKHIGDYWRYTGTDSLSPSREDIDQEEILPGDEFVYTYKDNEYKWEKLNVPDEIFDLLDGKNKIYYEEKPSSANIGDLSIQTTTGEDGKEYQKFYIYTGSQWIPLDPYSKLIATVNQVQDEVDKKTETWYQVTDPSEAWDDKNKHIGDLWFNPNESKNYIYNSSYEWAEADGVPNSVFDAIDGKRQVFVDTPEPPYKIGDLWVDLTNKTTKVATKDRDSEETYDSTDWTDIKTQDAQSALNQSQQAIDNLEDFIKDKYNPALASLQASIDGKINTWYTSADPSESWTYNITKKAHVGDLWYYTGTSNKIININTTAKPNSQWIWQEVSTDKYQWEIVNVPQEVFDKIDGVASIYTTIPSNPVIGDLLIPTNNINAEGRLYATGKVYKYDGTTWNEINYTDENYVNNKVDASKASALETVSKFLNGGITTNLSGSDYTISPYIGGGYLNIQSSEQNNMDDIYPIRVIIDPGKKDGDNINKDVILLQKGQKTLNATNKVNITWDYQKIFSVNEYGELHIGNDSHYIKFSPTIKNKTKDANGQYVTENSFLNIVTEQFDFNAVKPNADGTSSGIEFSSDYGLKMYNNSTDPLVEITPKGYFYVGDESKGYIRFDRGDCKGSTYLKIQAYDFDFKAGEINNSSSTREMVNGISFTKNGLYGFQNGVATFGFKEDGSCFLGANEETGRIEFNTGDNSNLKIVSNQFKLITQNLEFSDTNGLIIKQDNEEVFKANTQGEILLKSKEKNSQTEFGIIQMQYGSNKTRQSSGIQIVNTDKGQALNSIFNIGVGHAVKKTSQITFEKYPLNDFYLICEQSQKNEENSNTGNRFIIGNTTKVNSDFQDQNETYSSLFLVTALNPSSGNNSSIKQTDGYSVISSNLGSQFGERKYGMWRPNIAGLFLEIEKTTSSGELQAGTESQAELIADSIMLTCASVPEGYYGKYQAQQGFGTQAYIGCNVALIGGNLTPLRGDISIGARGNLNLSAHSGNGHLYGTWTSPNWSSDARLKHSIEDLSIQYEILFDQLQPKRYKYNNGTSNRYHTGFIAQEVLEAVKNASLTTQDFAAMYLVKREDSGLDEPVWVLRRDEFVALNTWQIQKLKNRVTQLENEIKELKHNEINK